MPKVRAAKRAERERRQQQALERNAKRMRRKMFWRKVTLHDWRRRSRGTLFARRSRGQRAFIGVTVAVALLVIWFAVPSLAYRVLFSVLLLLALPVFVIVAFDRRNS